MYRTKPENTTIHVAALPGKSVRPLDVPATASYVKATPSDRPMPRKPETTTTQMIALWSAAVEQKMAGALAPVLERLALREGATLSAKQCDSLSHLIARALQVAAAKGGGVSAAIDFLSEMAKEPEKEPIVPSRR